MAIRFSRWRIILLGLLIAGSSRAWALDADATACVGEIQRVCAHLEDHLENCLADRGDQLSASCREQLKTAMSFMKDPSGPAACVPDIQRFCPDLQSPAFAQCVTDKQSQFSEACQKYLQTASQK